MIKRDKLINSNILVLGYAMTGKSVANFLLNNGAQVTINDRGDLSTDPSVRLLLERGVHVVDGDNPVDLLDNNYDFIVKNPGIPYSIPLLEEALKREISIYTDIELASWYAKAPIVAITGSNGKTTTTSLTYHLLEQREAGKAYLAGNIGVPTLDVVEKAKSNDLIIMETSSFQLQGTANFHPHVAVLTNIYDAHLDYHKTRENYVKAKLKIATNLSPSDYLIYNYDQEELETLIRPFNAQQIPFARKKVDQYVRDKGIYVDRGAIYYQGAYIMDLETIQLPGEHNIENVLAATAIAKIYGIDDPSIIATVSDYQGEPHRIQKIATTKGRQFFNDSKATNITATMTALSSFDSSIIYIGGGLDRGNEFDELVPHLGQVKQAFLYGESKEKMAKAFKQAGIPVYLFDNLVEATTQAYHTAAPGDIVLFSPSCASWDQFKNYEARGEVFQDTVDQLIEAYPYEDE